MNDPFWIFAASWTAGVFGAAAFAAFGPALEALMDRWARGRAERRVRRLRPLPPEWPTRRPR